MPSGRQTRFRPVLTPKERFILTGWQRQRSRSAVLAQRARLILLLDAGLTVTAVAALVGLSRRAVIKWARRFLAQRLEGLRDLPKGRPPGA